VNDNLNLDDALDVCLDRLIEGVEPEACLLTCPSEAKQLAPLLHMAAVLRVGDAPVLPADVRDAGEARFLSRAAYVREQRAGSRPAQGRLFSGLLLGTRRLAAAAVVSVVVLFSVLGAGTVSASSSSLPGSPLYPVKRVSEMVVSAVAPTPRLQARAHLAWADRRLREAEAILQRDGTADSLLLIALGEETGQALIAAEQAGPETLAATVAHTSHQQKVLSRLLQQAPAAARPGLERALAASARRHEQAVSALERSRSAASPAASPAPVHTPPGQAKEKEPPGKGQKETPASPSPTRQPTATIQAVDDASPGHPGQAQDGKPGQGSQHGEQGPDPDHGQDKIDRPGGGQKPGRGGDQQDKLHPPGQDGRSEKETPIDRGTPPGQSGDKPENPDNSDKGGGKDK
jgi:hypothetical protein